MATLLELLLGLHMPTSLCFHFSLSPLQECMMYFDSIIDMVLLNGEKPLLLQKRNFLLLLKQKGFVFFLVVKGFVLDTYFFLLDFCSL